MLCLCSMQFGCAWRQAGATISKECPVAAVISFEHRLHRSGGPREQGKRVCETAGFAHSIPCQAPCRFGVFKPMLDGLPACVCLQQESMESMADAVSKA